MDDESVPLAGSAHEIREQITFPCGCVAYRQLKTNPKPTLLNETEIIIETCEKHATITNLSGRMFRRLVKWPPTEATLGRAARQGRPITYGQ